MSRTLKQLIDKSLLKEGKAESAISAEIAKAFQNLAQQFQKKSQVEAQVAQPVQPVNQAPVQQQPAASVKTKKKKHPDDDVEWK